jgi:putative ABC transport system substrate-binding protein
LGGAAAWPLAASAQQPDRVRRIGVLQTVAATDPEGTARMGAFLEGLQQLGWIDGRNVRIDTRWGAIDEDRSRQYAAELIALSPDILLATASPSVAALRAVSRTVPIVFANEVIE